MKKHLLFLFSVLFAVQVSSAEASDVAVGDKFHVTGCENGELMVPVVNMWSKPGGIASGAKVIGKLSGDGRSDQGLKCQGSVVKVVEVKKIGGRTFLKVQSVVNSKTGWVTDSYVGRKVK